MTTKFDKIFKSIMTESTDEFDDKYAKEGLEKLEGYMAQVDLNLGYAGQLLADLNDPMVEKRAGELGAEIQKDLHNFMDNFGGTSVEDAEGHYSDEEQLESVELGGKLYEVGSPDPETGEIIISVVQHSNGYMISTGQFSSPEDFVTKGPDSAIEAGGYALTLDGQHMDEDDLEDGELNNRL
jgi:hypothetical protein